MSVLQTIGAFLALWFLLSVATAAAWCLFMSRHDDEVPS